MQCGLDCQITGTSICKQIAHKSINGQPKRAGRKWIWYLITRDVSSHWARVTIETRTVSEISTEACHQKLFGTKLFSSSLQSVWMRESQKNNFLSHWMHVRSPQASDNDICHPWKHVSRSWPSNLEQEPAKIHIWNNWQLGEPDLKNVRLKSLDGVTFFLECQEPGNGASVKWFFDA